MYTEHYGLQQPPFGITPDTHFFFAHSSYQEALNTLLIAARSGEGFLKVVGEVGTGKTLRRKFRISSRPRVVRHLFQALPPAHDPAVGGGDELGVVYPGIPSQHLLKALPILIALRAGKRVVRAWTRRGRCPQIAGRCAC
jgi:MSHA biogenesis protein MshM